MMGPWSRTWHGEPCSSDSLGEEEDEQNRIGQGKTEQNCSLSWRPASLEESSSTPMVPQNLSHLELRGLALLFRLGKSRVTIVCMENDTIINNYTRMNCVLRAHKCKPTFAHCVATLQGQAGWWYLCRRKNVHGAIGMSGMPLFTGGQATHTANCVSICMSHVVALVPQHGTHCDTCPLVSLIIITPSRELLPV